MSSEDQMSDLVARYGAATTDREKAQIEAMIWRLTPKSERLKGPSMGIGNWFAAKYKVNAGTVTTRQRMFLAGPVANPLWDRIEKDMPLFAAVSLLRKAESYVKNTGVPLADAIQRVIKNYDSLGVSAEHKDGRVVRRRKQTDLPPGGELKPDTSDKTYKSFWMNLRVSISNYLDEKLGGVEPVEANRVRRIFESDMNGLIEDLQRLVHRTGAMKIQPISRNRLVQAFMVLGLEPSRPGKLPDMKLVNKRWKVHARAYHPDVHQGDESTRPMFEASKEAYEIIKQYCENIASSGVKSASLEREENGVRNGQSS